MPCTREPWRERFALQTAGRGRVLTVGPREVSPAGAPPLRIEKGEGTKLLLRFEDPEFDDQVGFNLYAGTVGGTFNDWAPVECGTLRRVNSPRPAAVVRPAMR